MVTSNNNSKARMSLQLQKLFIHFFFFFFCDSQILLLLHQEGIIFMTISLFVTSITQILLIGNL